MTGLDFSRKFRLTKAEDYQYVFANAQRFGNHNFTLLVKLASVSESIVLDILNV